MLQWLQVNPLPELTGTLAGWEKAGDGEPSLSFIFLLGLALGDSGRGDLGPGENRFEGKGEVRTGLRILRSSTCGSSSSRWKNPSGFNGKRDRSGDSLLVGVWAGEGEIL
jgi:hypothetical protein